MNGKLEKYRIYLTFGVDIETELSLEEAIEEFQSDVNYDLPSTVNVTVNNDELLEVKTQYP